MKSTIIVAILICAVYQIAFSRVFNLTSYYSESDQYTPMNANRPTKYLFFYAHAGFSNQLFALQRAMYIGFATDRTVIVPPLLPHIGSGTPYKFGGRAGKNFHIANKIAVDDAVTVMSLHNRTEFPSWSEIIDYSVLTKKTGVHLIDLFDFMRMERESAAVRALFHHTVEIDSMPVEVNDWLEFLDYFNMHFGNKTVALIGSAFVLPYEEAFGRHDEDAVEKIRRATLDFPPSHKLLDLIRAAIIHVPPNYIGVHIRFGDTYHLSHCDEKTATEEYNKLISVIRGANVTEGSAIYLGSKESNAKKCLEEYTHHDYKVFSLNDILNAQPPDVRTDQNLARHKMNVTIPNLHDAMNEICVDLGTKHLIIDMVLVSLGYMTFFGRVSFRPHYSTFQQVIEQRHELRTEFLSQLFNIKSNRP
ncbi:hypothetical protein ACHAW6_004966 [Cyclotella cf. meneghiniana]